MDFEIPAPFEEPVFDTDKALFGIRATVEHLNVLLGQIAAQGWTVIVQQSGASSVRVKLNRDFGNPVR